MTLTKNTETLNKANKNNKAIGINLLSSPALNKLIAFTKRQAKAPIKAILQNLAKTIITLLFFITKLNIKKTVPAAKPVIRADLAAVRQKPSKPRARTKTP